MKATNADFTRVCKGLQGFVCRPIKLPTMKSVGASKSANKPVAEPKEEKIDFSKVEVEPLFKDFVDFDTFSKSDFKIGRAHV